MNELLFDERRYFIQNGIQDIHSFQMTFIQEKYHRFHIA